MPRSPPPSVTAMKGPGRAATAESKPLYIDAARTLSAIDDARNAIAHASPDFTQATLEGQGSATNYAAGAWQYQATIPGELHTILSSIQDSHKVLTQQHCSLMQLMVDVCAMYQKDIAQPEPSGSQPLESNFCDSLPESGSDCQDCHGSQPTGLFRKSVKRVVASNRIAVGSAARLASSPTVAIEEGEESLTSETPTSPPSLHAALKNDEDDEFHKDLDLDQKVYRVEDFYHECGCAQAIARDNRFVNLTLGMITLNAIYLGIDADNNGADSVLSAKWYFAVSEHSFCAFFFAEWLIRFCAFKVKRDCGRDSWFKFDSFLVVLMVMETWVSSLLILALGFSGTSDLPTAPLRLLRLLRLSRLTRLLRTVPGLLTMINGMKSGFSSVASSLLLVFVLVYVFSIAILMFLKDEEGFDSQYSNLSRCMWTLLMDGTIMDNPGRTLTKLLDAHNFNCLISLFFFLVFILLSAMTVLNLLIGVICEVITEVSQKERDENAIRMMKETILLELIKFDEDGNKKISKSELETVMSDHLTLQVLHCLDVDVAYLRAVQHMLLPERESEATMDSILELMLNCRGTLPTTVRHLVGSQTFMQFIIESSIDRLQTYMDQTLRLHEQFSSSRLDAIAFQLNHLTARSNLSASPVLKYGEQGAPRQPNLSPSSWCDIAASVEGDKKLIE